VEDELELRVDQALALEVVEVPQPDGSARLHVKFRADDHAVRLCALDGTVVETPPTHTQKRC
jgi:hypothetical protein